MLKRLCTTTLAALAGLLPLSLASAASEEQEGLLRDGFVSNVDVIFAAKMMDSDWDVDGNETNLWGGGLSYTLRGIEWPVGLQIAYTVALNEESSNADLDSQDLQVGAFYAWGEGRNLRFEAGGGYAWSNVEVNLKGTTAGETDNIEVRANGVYARGAVRYGITNWLDVLGAAAFHYNPEDQGSETVNAGGILLHVGGGIRF